MADDTPQTEGESTAAADDPGGEQPLPDGVIDRAETLTRRITNAVDDNERDAYRRERESLLEGHSYDVRVREGDTGETLVLYPEEWVEEGTVQIDRIDDTDRAIERPISGPGSGADWEAIDSHNRAIADRVRERHGEVHGETAAAFADFMSNHYAKPIGKSTPDEREEFRSEYFPRNAWPTEKQRDCVTESLRLTLETADSA